MQICPELTYTEGPELELAEAVHDFSCPEVDGQGYMFFPIRR